MDQQEAAIAEAVRCGARRGSDFWFFHDFLILMSQIGPPGAAEMLERRHAAVEAAGGHPSTPLLEAFPQRVGVSWFNDQIHFSAIGHRYVAGFICAALG